MVYESQEKNKHIIAGGGMRCAEVLGHNESLGTRWMRNGWHITKGWRRLGESEY